MKTRFYVCGIGYDETDCITDYEQSFGDFDTYEEAYELFVKLQCRSEESFFTKATNVFQMLIQLEECEEDDEEINCIDVKNEWWIVNPYLMKHSTIGTWWSDDSIELVEIDNEIYALYGWNGERYLHCWQCIDEFTAVDENTEYEIKPIYNDDCEIVGYELI